MRTTIPNAVYTDEMRAELDRIDALVLDKVDFSRPPDDAARKIDADLNALWNIDLPDVDSVRRLTLPGDDALDAAVCDAIVYEPADAGEGLIFFVHGGGWAFLDLDTHERFMRLLAIEAGTTLIGVHYRLAPDHPYPAALRDVVSALRRVSSHRAEHGLPEGPVVIAGDSAGANLALAAMIHEIDAGRPLPSGGLLFYGVFGADFETPSYRAFGEGHVLTKPIMQQLWDWYVPDPDRRNDPLVAPNTASDDQLRALPPLFLAAAEMDPLASDTFDLQRRLVSLGRDDAVWIEQGVVHGFLQMTAVLEAARRAMREAAAAAKNFIDWANSR
jgi:acetyl esterase